MKGKLKKAISSIALASMVLTQLSPVVPANAKEQKAETGSAYAWVNYDKQLEFPAEDTNISASSTQSGYGAERMLDKNMDTRWEASWGNAPEWVDIILSTKDNEPEYFTGFQYVSRMDNNIAGTMSKYKVYISEDGTSYEETPFMEGEVVQKLDTFYFLFEEPVKAKAVKIVTDATAVSEMRLLYVPSTKADYDSLKAEAYALREEAGGKAGEDIGLWRMESLNTFDEGMEVVESQGEPDTKEELADVNRQIVELTSDLKRAQLASTLELNQKLRVAENLLHAAVVGDQPMMYDQEDVDAFRNIVNKVKETADNGAAGTGSVLDAEKMLEDGRFVFLQSQKKPDITYTGTASTPLSYIMDQLTESHFQGKGTGEDIYLELDYNGELEFESLTFQTWWATGQNISRISVDCKNKDGEWVPVDNGKEYTMAWTTNTNVSESQTVTFDNSVKGTALRIHILAASAFYVIDELTVGTTVSEEDMQIFLDREALTMAEGETAKLNATVLPEYASNKNVIFTSSNEEVLKVEKDGTLIVVGLPSGSEKETVVVTATTEYGNKSASCTVTVVPKMADEEEKQDTSIRLKNAWKLADAAKEEDYKDGAIQEFKGKLEKIGETLEQEVTVGEISELNEEIHSAETKFEEASIIPIRETKNLIDRITGEGSSENFIIETIPADEETGRDVYEVDWDAKEKKPVLRGNDGVSLATAYNYYLKYYAYLDFPYVGECSLTLPKTLPEVEEPVRIVFPYEYRHYFNENCEYKYTVDLYGEEEWQHRIDWMAMNGFNMFLIDLGEHAIWYNAKEELGLNDAAIEELQHYSSGTEQYYGKYEISLDAIKKEGELAKKVVDMAFKAGMEPEIRPFVGQVPFMFPDQHEDYYGSTSKAKMTISLDGSLFDGMFLYSAARWINLPQGVFISPEVAAADADKADEMKEKFVQISDIYYASLMEVLGYDEWGRTPAYAYKDLVGEQGFVVQHEAFPQKVIGEMNDQLMKLNPDAIWLQTSWRYQSWLPQYYDEGHLMFVDLSAENRPKWNTNNEFGGTPWLWSMLFNFGGNSGIEGDLTGVAADVLDAKENSQYMRGVSISPEGGDTNPALYAMMAEMTWRSEAPDMEKWIQDYVKRRYGVENYEAAKEEIDGAWKTLCGTAYKDFVGYDGPAQTLVNAYPKLSGSIARVYGSNAKLYETQDFLPAWEYMLKAAEKMEEPTEQFLYDLVDITRQALADISGEVYTSIKPAFDAQDKEEAMRYADWMIRICEDLDEILATNKNFMIGTRLEGAKGRGVTESDKEFYEQVERTFLTYWVLDDPNQASLTDYCNRHLSGLMTDYYGMRWEVFAKYLEQALDEDMTASEFNDKMSSLIEEEIKENEVAWSKDHTKYPTKTQGDAVEISKKLFEEYQPLIKELYGASDDSKDLPLEGMTATAGNEQAASGTEGPAYNVLDGNTSTIWHTDWNGSERDVQWIDISLGKEQIVDGLRYLPRQGGGVNGIVTAYEIYISDDNGQTYTKVAEGTWKQNSLWRVASFDAVKATNVKLQVVDAASDKDQLFASAAEIRITKGELTPQEPISTDILEYTLELSEKADTTGVIESVVKKFEETKTNAQEILDAAKAGDESVTQEMVDNAWKELIHVMQYLSFKQGDKTDLAKVIALADEMNKNLDSYLEEGKDGFVKALDAAKTVQEDGDAMQEDVNNAWKELLTAMAGLQKIPDKTALEELLKQAEELDEADYEAVSFAAFKAAYAETKAVYENEQATKTQVSAATESLEEAIAKLTPAKGIDKDTVANAGSIQTGSDDKRTATDKNGKVTQNAVDTAEKSAKTGDETNTALPMAAGVFAAVAAAFVWKKRR